MVRAVHAIYKFLVDALSGLEFRTLTTILVLHTSTVTLKTMVCKRLLSIFGLSMETFGLKAFENGTLFSGGCSTPSCFVLYV